MVKMIEVHNPMYAPAPPAVTLRKVAIPSLPQGATLRVASISNQKPHTNDLVAGVLAKLSDDYLLQQRSFFKQDEAHPAPPDVINEVREFADLAIVSTGD
jgi:hypothetical protein